MFLGGGNACLGRNSPFHHELTGSFYIAEVSLSPLNFPLNTEHQVDGSRISTFPTGKCLNYCAWEPR